MKQVWILFKKEFVESFRDKSVIFTNYVLPLILFPLITAIGVERALHLKEKQEKSSFAVMANWPTNPRLYEQFIEHKNFKTIDHNNIDNSSFNEYHRLISAFDFELRKEKSQQDTKLLEQYQKSIFEIKEVIKNNSKDKAVDLVLYFKTLKNNNRIAYLFYDTTVELNEYLYAQVKEILDKEKSTLLKSRLQDKKLEEHYIQPLSLHRVELSGVTEEATKKSAGLIGIIVFIFIWLTMYYPGINSTIGEKDRQTLPSLLLTPTDLKAIIFGKYLNIITHGLLGLFPYLLLPVFSFFLIKKNIGFQLWDFINFKIISIIFLCLLSAAFLLAAIVFLVGSIAKNKQHAQSFYSSLLILGYIPIIYFFHSPPPLNLNTSLIPFLNFGLLIKEILNQSNVYLFVFTIIFSNLFYSTIILSLSLSFYRTHLVLADSQLGLSDLLAWRKVRLPEVNFSMAILYFSLIFTITFYINTTFSKETSIITISIVNQLLILGGGILLICFNYFLPLKQALKWGTPKPIGIVFSLIGAAIFVLINIQLSKFIPIPDSLQEAFSEVFKVNEPQSMIILIIMVGILPGIFEELAFRGIIYNGLRKRLPPWSTIFLSALFFGLNHYSLFRFMPTFIMGLFLGLVRHKGKSLVYCIVIHITYNTILVLMN